MEEENYLEIVMRHFEGNGKTIKNGIFWLSLYFFFNGILVIIYVLMVVVWIAVNYLLLSFFFFSLHGFLFF